MNCKNLILPVLAGLLAAGCATPRLAEGEYRFFNVADGLEDCRMSMERFGAEHLKGGFVLAFALPELS